MEDALGRFLQYQRAIGNTAKTVTNYGQNIRCFMRWLEENGTQPDLTTLTVDTARDWIVDQQRRGLSPFTVRTRTRALKTWGNWLAAEAWLPVNPLARLKMPKTGDKAQPTLSPQEVDLLLAACDPSTVIGARDRAIILLLWSTCLRSGELLALSAQDMIGDRLLVRRGKGGKVRIVPRGDEVGDAIDHYLTLDGRNAGTAGPLFCTDEGTPLTHSGLRQLLRRRAEPLGLHANPHKWRHSAAIAYLRAGGTLETLQQLLGHSTLNQTLHYARLAGEDVVRAHKTADPVRLLKRKN